MPPFIRKRRGWDLFTPAWVRHLRPDEKQRLVNTAQRAANQDGLLLFFLVPTLLSYVLVFWVLISVRTCLLLSCRKHLSRCCVCRCCSLWPPFFASGKSSARPSVPKCSPKASGLAIASIAAISSKALKVTNARIAVRCWWRQKHLPVAIPDVSSAMLLELLNGAWRGPNWPGGPVAIFDFQRVLAPHGFSNATC